MAISTNPTSSANPNLLSNVTFNFNVDRFPNMNFYVQSVTLPGIQIMEIPMETGLARLSVKEPAAKATFEPFTVTYMVDEDMNNYIEIWDWINTVGGLKKGDYGNLKSDVTGNSIKSTIMIDILTSHRNNNIRCKFQDAFPTSLEALTFDFRNPSVDYQPMTVSFTYNYFTMEKL